MKRLDQAEPSTARLQMRLTPEADGSLRGLAWYFGMGVSQFIRELCEEKRRELRDAGKQPRLSPPENADWGQLEGGARIGHGMRLVASMTQEESDKIRGLAWHCKWTVAELIRRLVEQKRRRLASLSKKAPLSQPDGPSPRHPWV